MKIASCVLNANSEYMVVTEEDDLEGRHTRSAFCFPSEKVHVPLSLRRFYSVSNTEALNKTADRFSHFAQSPISSYVKGILHWL